MNVGDVLASKYRVDRVLGMGGMGVVVAATHLDLEQSVALKFLLPSMSVAPVIVERFLREARASVRLKSPHVARTLDTGRLENGCPFIVMELLEGRDLAAEVEAGGAPLQVQDVASWVLHACDALAEAHALGIVHRDLKPANLFLARGHDGHDQVKILDFGISKLMPAADASGPSASMTATDSVFGSPAYMSPEQMRSSKEVDARTDIWSVGVVLYELATGHLPFDAPTALEIGLKASQDAPTRPRTLRPDLPEVFERLVLRCLEKDPDQRFASVVDLAQALAPFAHPRDRGLADRIRDIAGARGQRTSDPHAVVGASAPMPPDLGLQETQIAPDKTAAALDATHQALTALTAEPRKERRSLDRPLAAAAVVALVVTGAVLSRRLDRASADTTVDPSPSGASLAAASVEPPASTASQPEPTVASAVASAAAPEVSSAKRPSAVGHARPLGASPASKPDQPTRTTSPVSPSAPDAGRFFRVRE